MRRSGSREKSKCKDPEEKYLGVIKSPKEGQYI